MYHLICFLGQKKGNDAKIERKKNELTKMLTRELGGTDNVQVDKLGRRIKYLLRFPEKDCSYFWRKSRYTFSKRTQATSLSYETLEISASTSV